MNAKILTKMMKSVFAGLMMVALLVVTSCEKTQEPPPTPEPQPAKYTIKGTVVNQATNAALPGVLVTMGLLNQTTTATGSFEFANLTTAGKYTLVFTKADFFSSTYSLEFLAASPNHTLIYTLSATMVPYVPGITPLNPITGGTIPVTGGVTTTLTFPPNTTVKDAAGVPVTGNINITAVTTPDIFIPGATNNPGLAVLRFEPSGLQFSTPLPLVIDNTLTGYRFPDIRLEFFNPLTNLWEPQTQPVTYLTATNDYSTTISHFSIYKIATASTITTLASTIVPLIPPSVEVTDSVIRNFSLINLTVRSIRYKHYIGYKTGKTIATYVSELGITGADATAVTDMLSRLVTNWYGIGSAAPTTTFAVNSTSIPVVRTVIPKWKLMTSGTQKILNYQVTIRLQKLSDNSMKTVVIDISVADQVTLAMVDMIFDTHDHGMGGGGAI